MTIDFRASQIQTVKIISSGSTGTNAKILIYDIAADIGGAAGNQGQINPAVFSTASIGEDIFLFISGWSGSIGTSTAGATVFGGDVRISGGLIVDGSSSIPGLGTGAGAVDSVFGRTGAVVAVASDYSASEVFNDSTGVQGDTVSAALDTLNTGVSAALTTVSGTNFGDGTATINTSVSSSNTLNFFTLSGSGGIVVSNSGDIVDISGSAGGGAVDSVFGRTGAVVATADDYAASEVTNDSNVTGTNVDDALNTLSASNTTLSGVVATDINTLESDISTNSSAITTLSGAVAADINSVESSIVNLSASDIFNDSTSIQGSTVSAALDTLNTGVSASLSEVSGTNFSSGSAVYTTVSSSNTLNFRTLVGIGGVGVSTSGDAIEISGSAGAVESVFSRTGVVTAAASDYNASQVDNDSNVVGSFVDDALNTLSASNINLSSSVATDINSVESDISTNSSAITTLSNSVAADVITLSSSLFYLSASDIFNDSTSIQGSTVSAALDTLNTGVSASLSEVSGTNFGDAQPLYSSVSSSNVLNFRTISGSDYIGVETVGDVVVISSSQNTLVISPAASITLNLSSSTIFRYELSQNTSISMSNNWDGATGILRMKHDGTANSYAVTWSSQFRRMDSENLNPTQTSAAVDVYSFVVDEELVHISKTANWVPVT